jgi:hypothetical protein
MKRMISITAAAGTHIPVAVAMLHQATGMVIRAAAGDRRVLLGLGSVSQFDHAGHETPVRLTGRERGLLPTRCSKRGCQDCNGFGISIASRNTGDGQRGRFPLRRIDKTRRTK